MAINQTDLSEVKDWIYVIVTPFQLALSLMTFIVGVVIVGCLRTRKNRKKDREKARLKADTEKIAAVLSEKYDEAEKKIRDLKTTVDKLKQNTINDELTEFDVLLYKYHSQKWQILQCPETARTMDNKIYHAGTEPGGIQDQDGRSKIVSDVNEIMKLFLQFRIQLSSIHDKACPQDIKTEFSEEIFIMGQTIYPFVSTSRQKIIEKVLIYFGCTEFVQQPDNPAQKNHSCGCMQRCFPCRRRQNMSEPANLPLMPTPCANQQANEGLTPYCGHDVIKNAIPYIEYFMYENGKMKYSVGCPHSNITNLEAHVKIRELRIMRKENEIREKIGELLDGEVPEGDLLHVIRIVMLKIKEGYFASSEKTEKLDTFIRHVKRIDSQVSLQASVLQCERDLDRVKQCIDYLEGVHKAVLQSSDTPNFLHNMATNLEQFITEHVN